MFFITEHRVQLISDLFNKKLSLKIILIQNLRKKFEKYEKKWLKRFGW